MSVELTHCHKRLLVRSRARPERKKAESEAGVLTSEPGEARRSMPTRRCKRRADERSPKGAACYNPGGITGEWRNW